MRLFYNGRCIRPMSECKTIESKSKGILIAKYKFDCSKADLFPEFNEGFEYTFVDEQVDERDVMSIDRETVTIMTYDAKPDEYGVLATEYEVETPVLVNAGDIVTRSIYSNELPTKMTFGYNQDSSYSNETIASSLLSVISMNCSKLIDGYRMFKDCSNLTSINYDWSQCRLQHHIGMFQNCKSLIDVNFEGLVTSNSINMASMFLGCHSLTEINTNGWNTSNVKDMSNAFDTCKNLTLLDVSKFNTSKVTNMRNMFYNCNKLADIIGTSNWDTSNIMDMGAMFYKCTSLTKLEMKNWKINKESSLASMFSTCSNLIELDLSSWENMPFMIYGMFYGCEKLTTLNLDNICINEEPYMSSYYFYECKNLINITIKNSDYNSVNKIIGVLPTRTSDSIGTLNINGINDISKVDTSTAQSKHWNVIKKQLVAEYKFNNSIYNENNDSPIYRMPKPITFNYGLIDTGIQLLKNDSDWTMFLDCIPNIDNTTQAIIHCVDEINNLFPGISLSFENGFINFYNGVSGTTIGNGNYLNKNIKIVIVKKGANIIIYHNDDPLYQVTSPVTIPYTFKSVDSTLSIGGEYMKGSPNRLFTGSINNFVLYNEALEDQECNSIINNGLLPEIASPIYQIPEPITFNNSGFMDTEIQLLKDNNNWSLFLDCIPNLNNKTQAVIHCVDEYGSCPGISFSFEPNGCINIWDGTKGTVIGQGNYLNKNIKIIIVRKDNNILVYHNDDPIYQASSPITIPYTFKGANTTLSIGGGHNGALALHSFSGIINNFVIYNKALEGQECDSIINNIDLLSETDNGLLPEFNDEFTNYEIVDTVQEDIVTRSIYSDSLPTLMRFGSNLDSYVEGSEVALLEVLDMNTSGLTNCSKMFRYCKNLTSVTCNWDTSNVTNMSAMFQYCTSLITLDLSNWDTSNVTDMQSIFNGCTSLTTVGDVSNWSTSNVQYMSYMFSHCKVLKSLDLTEWDTSNVIVMNHMFDICYDLTTIGDIQNWDVGSVTNMTAMFGTCRSLENIDITRWNTNNLINTSWMFNKCFKIKELDLSNWNTSNIVNLQGMFNDCEQLTHLNLNGWNISIDSDTSQLFSYIYTGCPNLNNIEMNNSNYTSINKIITELPTRTSNSMGTLNVTGVDDIFQIDITAAKSKYWNVI